MCRAKHLACQGRSVRTISLNSVTALGASFMTPLETQIWRHWHCLHTCWVWVGWPPLAGSKTLLVLLHSILLILLRVKETLLVGLWSLCHWVSLMGAPCWCEHGKWFWCCKLRRMHMGWAGSKQGKMVQELCPNLFLDPKSYIDYIQLFRCFLFFRCCRFFFLFVGWVLFVCLFVVINHSNADFTVFLCILLQYLHSISHWTHQEDFISGFWHRPLSLFKIKTAILDRSCMGILEKTLMPHLSQAIGFQGQIS